jgi:hypothetical protein
VDASEFDETAFFRSIETRGLRALLIGRRALVVLGLPVLTADYDFWLHGDDITAFNAIASPFGLFPTHSPEEARSRGRYVLQNDERVDVLVARSVPTVGGVRLAFDDIWERRRSVPLRDGVTLAIPSLEDLISTKRIGGRAKDLEDIKLLEALREGGRS